MVIEELEYQPLPRIEILPAGEEEIVGVAIGLGWSLVEHTFTEIYITRLPNPTINIQADNRDSFQGPVTDIELDTTPS